MRFLILGLMLARVLLLDHLDEPRDRREVLRALHERAVTDLDGIRRNTAR